MALLNLPADGLLLNLLGMLICLFIVIASVCRINASDVKRWRVSCVQVMYLCFVFWAAGVFFELGQGAPIDFHGGAGALGILLHLHITRFRHRRKHAARMAREQT
jgi:type VI protein secretion system component VasK